MLWITAAKGPPMSDTPLGRLTGRRIVITGAASGIGRATARLFRAEGARLVLVDRNAEALQAEAGSDVALALDITNPDTATQAIAGAAKALGGLDGLVNCAGIMRTGPTAEVTPETWRAVIDVNLSGSFYMVQACLPFLQAAEGSSIVNIASGAGLLPNGKGLAAYAASKGGVIALTKALASDLAPGIRVNCVCPGMVDTPMADGHRAGVVNYALKRMADPAEIAAAILFLMGPEGSFVTGVALAVDGGRTFH